MEISDIFEKALENGAEEFVWENVLGHTISILRKENGDTAWFINNNSEWSNGWWSEDEGTELTTVTINAIEYLCEDVKIPAKMTFKIESIDSTLDDYSDEEEMKNDIEKNLKNTFIKEFGIQNFNIKCNKFNIDKEEFYDVEFEITFNADLYLLKRFYYDYQDWKEFDADNISFWSNNDIHWEGKCEFDNSAKGLITALEECTKIIQTWL